VNLVKVMIARISEAIKSYRMGMQKILAAVGNDGILLGCNAPVTK